MIRGYIRKIVAEAVRDAVLSLPEAPQPEGRDGSSRMRDDIDTMVKHGADLEALATALSAYAHKNIHDLRNMMTAMQLMLDQMREEVARQEQTIAVHLKAAVVTEPPA